MTQVERYTMLLGAREALRHRIAGEAADPMAHPGQRLDRNPDRLTRVYGELAKLDAEIADLEVLFLGQWRDAK